MTRCQLHTLPREIAENILLRVPIDSHLRSLALLSNNFRDVLCTDLGFAWRHVSLHLGSAPTSFRIAGLAALWRFLPVSYKTALFALLVARRDSLPETGPVSTCLVLRILYAITENRQLFGSGWKDLAFAFSWFCAGNHVAPARLVLRNATVSPLQLKFSLLKAAENGSVDIMKYALVECWVNDADLGEALAEAARHGRVEAARVLVNCKRIATNAKSYALVEALRCNQAEVVRLLMADPDANPFYNDGRPYKKAEAFMRDEVSRVMREMLRRRALASLFRSETTKNRILG
ncbi:hypothetical protein BC830DRAFT_245745, partial [Chytriomyces sp. MP71]